MARWMGVALLIAMAQVASAMAEKAQPPNYYCGYKISRHNVTSGDGYITTTFRLPRNQSGRADGRPVLLQHSFGYNADAWFYLGRNSLPCLLAAEGFDVWVASARGSIYSKGHTRYDADWFFDWPMYWSFSFHEMAVSDLPVTIDYILQTTKRDNLSYVGHGMGGTMIFILLSEKPKYNEKIKGSVTFVPTCYTSVDDDAARWIAKGISILEWIYNEIAGGMGEHLESQATANNQHKRFAYEARRTFEYVLNKNASRARSTDLFGPDERSAMTFLHLCQLVYTEKFLKYHYSTVANLEVYGRANPPPYRLQRVTTEQLIMYSQADQFINLEGARKLCSKLLKRQCEQVLLHEFRHDDFIKSKLAKQHVYERAMRELRSYLPPLPTTPPPPPENPECLV